MATEGSAAGRELFDNLNIDYENAYGNNPFKKACVEKAISIIQTGRVLDVGCGTGIPVSQMLADAGMEVTGVDIAPKMVELAAQRVKGTFEVADVVEYKPQGSYAGIFIIYSQLQLSYKSFHTVVTNCVQALQQGGIIAIGQSPTDGHVPADDEAFDETKSYVEAYPHDFWGKPVDTFMMSQEGLRSFLQSMGFEIVYETLDWFQPDHPSCGPENQQYIIARKNSNAPVVPPPRPLPKVKT